MGMNNDIAISGDKMKRIILLVLVLSFVALAAQKPDPKAIVGKIDDKTYTYAEYEKILENYFNYHQNQKGKPLTDDEKMDLNNRCWEELVGRYIYDKAIKAGKIKLTNQELLREAKKNPPAAVKNIPDLKTKGKFDTKQYEKALDENKQFRDAVIAEVRNLYQYTKLLDTIRNEAKISEADIRAQWSHNSETVDAKIIFFDANRMTNVVASNDEARVFFQERIEEYRKDDCRRYSFVKFSGGPSKQDSLTVKEQVWQLYYELLAGADFAEMAREKSADPGSGAQGGDLGWFGRGRMVPVFEDTAFATPTGQIAEPVLSNFGWHIIQTLDRRGSGPDEEVSARHILIRVEASQATSQNMKKQSLQLHELAGKKGLLRAADELRLEIQESGIFQAKDAFIPGIGRDAALSAFAFENEEGALADLYYSPSGDAFVCELSGVYPTYYPSFEEEKNRVMNNANSAKRGHTMSVKVQDFIARLSPDEYLQGAEQDSILVVEISKHKKGDNLTSIGKHEQIEEALFNTPEGTFAPLISEAMRWFLVKVERHAEPDNADWEKNKKKLISDATDNARQDHLNEWYRQERQKVSIIDNRRDYYELGAAGRIIQL